MMILEIFCQTTVLADVILDVQFLTVN